MTIITTTTSLIIINITASALRFASDELKNDIEVAYEAVRHNPYAIKYVDLDLIENRELQRLAYGI